ncbi:hypothetical protein DRE_07510 [Drechslerella stenobrocha 248]|uniref:Uncharacterized protein n=1 Tax=Drechslerella stenobrocha 248 TaxID=1043628 RepID=W7I464_9PEZI|nr:hypothetical protein DRE_07510 [Drechslerella stenobrocha 248]
MATGVFTFIENDTIDKVAIVSIVDTSAFAKNAILGGIGVALALIAGPWLSAGASMAFFTTSVAYGTGFLIDGISNKPSDPVIDQILFPGQSAFRQHGGLTPFVDNDIRIRFMDLSPDGKLKISRYTEEKVGNKHFKLSEMIPGKSSLKYEMDVEWGLAIEGAWKLEFTALLSIRGFKPIGTPENSKVHPFQLTDLQSGSMFLQPPVSTNDKKLKDYKTWQPKKTGLEWDGGSYFMYFVVPEPKYEGPTFIGIPGVRADVLRLPKYKVTGAADIVVSDGKHLNETDALKPLALWYNDAAKGGASLPRVTSWSPVDRKIGEKTVPANTVADHSVGAGAGLKVEYDGDDSKSVVYLLASDVQRNFRIVPK